MCPSTTSGTTVPQGVTKYGRDECAGQTKDRPCSMHLRPTELRAGEDPFTQNLVCSPSSCKGTTACTLHVDTPLTP